MDLQQGLKVKRKAGEGGLIMEALVELEKAEAAALESASRNTPVSPSSTDDRVSASPHATGLSAAWSAEDVGGAVVGWYAVDEDDGAVGVFGA